MTLQITYHILGSIKGVAPRVPSASLSLQIRSSVDCRGPSASTSSWEVVVIIGWLRMCQLCWRGDQPSMGYEAHVFFTGMDWAVKGRRTPLVTLSRRDQLYCLHAPRETCLGWVVNNSWIKRPNLHESKWKPQHQPGTTKNWFRWRHFYRTHEGRSCNVQRVWCGRLSGPVAAPTCSVSRWLSHALVNPSPVLLLYCASRPARHIPYPRLPRSNMTLLTLSTGFQATVQTERKWHDILLSSSAI